MDERDNMISTLGLILAIGKSVVKAFPLGRSWVYILDVTFEKHVVDFSSSQSSFRLSENFRNCLQLLSTKTRLLSSNLHIELVFLLRRSSGLLYSHQYLFPHQNTPARNRTWIYGSGGRRVIRYTTGANTGN